MKIATIRTWNASGVRNVCIDNEFYTCGSNESYIKLLDYVDSHKPTTTNIFKVAADIVKHSSLESYGQTENENIQSVMFALENGAVSTFYRICEREV